MGDPDPNGTGLGPGSSGFRQGAAEAPSPSPQPPAGVQTDGTAIAVLVLAIASFLFLPLIPAIVALALAPSALRKIQASNGSLTGENLVKAGQVIAWVNVGLAVLFVVIIVLFAGAFMSAGL